MHVVVIKNRLNKDLKKKSNKAKGKKCFGLHGKFLLSFLMLANLNYDNTGGGCFLFLIFFYTKLTNPDYQTTLGLIMKPV